VMAVLCDWNGTDPQVGGAIRAEAFPASYPRGVIR
jgi:hypothetical protein